MKLTDAFWEKKNLGMKVLEVQFEENDTIDTEIIYEGYEYVLVKVPAGKIDIVHKLEKNGFVFLETKLNIIKRVREIAEGNRYLSHLSKNTDYVEISDYSKIEDVLNKIDENLFDTDRVALDPIFNIEISNKRYKNWIRNVLEQGVASLYEIVYEGDSVGFSLISIKGKRMELLLGGLYSEYKGSGLGFTIIEKPLQLSTKLGVKFIETSISTNNVAVYKLYQSFGFDVRTINYVLRKVV